MPVVNALTDEFHPCQILADLQTVRERLGPLAGRTLTYLGDGANNMANSYLLGGATAGHARADRRARPATSPTRRSSPQAQRIAAETGGSAAVARRPGCSPAKGADVLATDVWVSMGQEDEAGTPAGARPLPGQRRAAGAGRPGRDRAALPARPPRRGDHRRGDRRPASAVWDQAENRLHAQKALLAWLLEQS